MAGFQENFIQFWSNKLQVCWVSCTLTHPGWRPTVPEEQNSRSSCFHDVSRVCTPISVWKKEKFNAVFCLEYSNNPDIEKTDGKGIPRGKLSHWSSSSGLAEQSVQILVSLTRKQSAYQGQTWVLGKPSMTTTTDSAEDFLFSYLYKTAESMLMFKCSE